jgi:Ca2+-binding RTX toxin-like protein
MKIFGGGGGGRRLGKRASAFVVAGSLVAFQAIAIVGAQVAAATSCTFSAGVLTVNSDMNQSIDVSRADDTATAAIVIPACPAGTGGATVANTTLIDINGDAAGQDVSIDLDDGGFGTIDWTIDLDGAPAATDQTLTISGDPAAGVDNTIILGASGVDLDGDGDLDITSLTGLATTAAQPFAVFVFGGGGAADDVNVLSAAGDTTTGAAFAQNVEIVAGAGDNTIAGGAGADLLTGGGAFSTLDCSAATSAVVNIPTGGSNAGVSYGGVAAVADNTCGGGSDFWTGFDGVIGSPGNDTLRGSAADEYFAPNGGTDVITGGGGDDELDFSFEASGVTVDTAAGTSASEDGTANTTFSGSDFFVDGTDFVDTLDFSGETGPIEANLGDTDVVTADTEFCGNIDANEVDGATLVNGSTAFENAIGSPGNDTIAGSGANNNLNGGEGDDDLCGLAANDNLLGGPGNNSLDGGTGFDATSYADVPVEPGDTGVEADLTVGFGSGPDRNDVLANIENLTGSAGKDDLRGSNGNNTIKGAKSADNIRGGSGDDTLRGGAGKDAVRGGSGDDDLFGGGANDRLFGGGGTDFGNGGKGKDVCQGVEIKRSCGTKKNPK